MRTNRQKWQSERCWRNRGSIARTTALLRIVANCASTLPQESEELKIIAAKLGNMAQIWNDERVKRRSWNMYRIGNKMKGVKQCP